MALPIYAQTLKFEDVASLEQFSEFQEYYSFSGLSFKVGDTIVFGQPSNERGYYNYLQQSGFMIVNNEVTNMKGSKGIIQKIVAGGAVPDAVLVCKVPKMPGVYSFHVEDALKSGEIVSDLLTEEEAIEKIKKAKSLLDLGIISQEKFDSIKVEYSRFIHL